MSAFCRPEQAQKLRLSLNVIIQDSPFLVFTNLTLVMVCTWSCSRFAHSQRQDVVLCVNCSSVIVAMYIGLLENVVIQISILQKTIQGRPRPPSLCNNRCSNRKRNPSHFWFRPLISSMYLYAKVKYGVQ